MNNISVHDLLRLRLRSLGITHSAAALATSGDVLTHLGAVQAQDYLGAKWSLGMRLPGTTDADVEAAIARRDIVRTWALRGTLHFLPGSDVRWMLDLIAPRALANLAGPCRRLELTEDVIARSQAVMADVLAGGQALTRAELFAALEKACISLHGNRGSFILYRAAMAQVICQGVRRGSEFTFVLLDEWLPPSNSIALDVPLAELTRRYFTSHGPATERDFAWWSGMTLGQVRSGIAMIRPELVSLEVEGQSHWMSAERQDVPSPSTEAHLLPGFDEFMLGYGDHAAAIPEGFRESLTPANGVFSPIVVIDGHAVGTWRRTLARSSMSVAITPFLSVSKAQNAAIAEVCANYCAFQGKALKGE